MVISKKSLIGIGIFLWCFFLSFLWITENKGETYTKKVAAIQFSSPSAIDKKNKDDAWLEAAINGSIVAGFVNQGGGNLASCQMPGFVVYDNENLYIGVRVYPSSMEKLTQKAYRDDDKNICRDDHIEIFTQPYLNSKTYYQFSVNSQNFKAIHYGEETPFFKTATYKGNNFWSAEILIPLSIIDITPNKGKVWGVNMAGAHTTSGFEWITWVKAHNFHNVEKFGQLILKE